MNKEDAVLQNQTTIRVFLYCRQNGSDTGVREIQRNLGMKSSSTASWHLEKLITAGLLEKSPSNRFSLSDKGWKINKMKLPDTLDVKMIGNQIFADSIFVISLLISSIVFSILMWFLLEPFVAYFYNLLVIIVITLYHIKTVSQERKKIKYYTK